MPSFGPAVLGMVNVWYIFVILCIIKILFYKKQSIVLTDITAEAYSVCLTHDDRHWLKTILMFSRAFFNSEIGWWHLKLI